MAPIIFKNGLDSKDDALTVLRTILTNILTVITIPFLLISAILLFSQTAYLGSFLNFCGALLLIWGFYQNKKRNFLIAKSVVLPALSLLSAFAITKYGRDVDIQILLLTLMIFVYILFDKKIEWLIYSVFIFLCFLLPYLSLEIYGPIDDSTNVPYFHFVVMSFALLACSLLAYVLMQALKKYLKDKNDTTQLLLEKNIELEEKSLYIQNQKDELELFTAIASHDLKTPIRTINSFIGLIERDQDLKNPKTIEYLKIVKRGSEQLKNVIEGIATFNRIEALDRSLSPVDVKNIIAKTIAKLYTRIENGIEGQFNVSEIPNLKMNGFHLELLFHHLVENALKFNTETFKTVEITHELKDDYLNIYVKDNGIGIPEAYQAYIFKPFKKLQASDQFQSSGLGLAICEKIIGLYQGEITVESNSDRGSTFTVSIPISFVLD